VPGVGPRANGADRARAHARAFPVGRGPVRVTDPVGRARTVFGGS